MKTPNNGSLSPKSCADLLPLLLPAVRRILGQDPDTRKMDRVELIRLVHSSLLEELIQRGMVERPGDGEQIDRLAFTEDGVGTLGQLPSEPGEKRITPHWDEKAGSLWWGGVLVKCCRDDAVHQRIVLGAFEAQGWVQRLVDPLQRNNQVCSNSRRYQTAESLNGNQMGPVKLRFRVEREHFRWEVIE